MLRAINEQVNCEICEDTGTNLIMMSHHTGQVRFEEVSCEECCEHTVLRTGICTDCGKDLI